MFDEVLCLIRGIFGDQSIRFSSLYDWKELAENYPATNEKLAEHQREVIPYITSNIDNKLKDFRKERLLNSKLLFKNPHEISFPEYGCYLTEVTAFKVS